jgi:hypothetical protein
LRYGKAKFENASFIDNIAMAEITASLIIKNFSLSELLLTFMEMQAHSARIMLNADRGYLADHDK